MNNYKQFKKMKNYKSNYALSLVILLFSVFATIGVCYLYTWTYNWDARISKIEEILNRNASMQADSLIKTLQIRDVKEAIYISQLDHLSDWLIAFVTLLFGVSIISQLLTFEARTKRISDQYEEQKTENENHIKEVEEKFKLSEKDNIVAFISIFEFQGAYY